MGNKEFHDNPGIADREIINGWKKWKLKLSMERVRTCILIAAVSTAVKN